MLVDVGCCWLYSGEGGVFAIRMLISEGRWQCSHIILCVLWIEVEKYRWLSEMGDFSCSFLASTPQLGRGRAGWVVGMASYDVVPKARRGFQLWRGCPLALS